MPVALAENIRDAQGMAEPIRRLRDRLGQLGPAQIRVEAGHLHQYAGEQGLALLAGLAQQMIRHLGPDGARGIASVYLDMMADAAQMPDLGACDRHVDHWLALVAVRLGA
jgi:hypothetical protein